MKLSGWGNYPKIEATCFYPRNLEDLVKIISESSKVIARGNGRAYGDSAINESATIQMLHFNKMIEFDDISGRLVAESGVFLSDIILAFLPRGWFPAVTPGTKFVTLGGMIAADVHGKNHHSYGSFRECVDWIDILGPDGEIRRCSRDCNSELFNCTLGGMGLTGIILRAAIRLRSVETGWIRQKKIAASNLRSVISIIEETEEATYSVAWIDCLSRGKNLGRSIVILGEHAKLSDLPNAKALDPFNIPHKRKISIPFDIPFQILNSFTVKLFNNLYYRSGTKSLGSYLVGWDSYFYPLDAILGWNRIYGRKGFVQFQCVLPQETAEVGLSKLLNEISSARAGSFLAVLKRFGKQESRFSFPMAGYTLALDFPVSIQSFDILDKLHNITIEFGGRFYLAKDSCMSAVTLRASDNRTEPFIETRRINGWNKKFYSSQAERLLL